MQLVSRNALKEHCKMYVCLNTLQTIMMPLTGYSILNTVNSRSYGPKWLQVFALTNQMKHLIQLPQLAHLSKGGYTNQ